MGDMPRIPVAILGALFIALALVAGAACGFGSVEPVDSPPSSPPVVDSPPSPEASPSPIAPTSTPNPAPGPGPDPNPDPEPSPEPSGADQGAGPVTGFTDGQWLVNSEVAPGRYRTVLPVEETGSWLGCDAGVEGPGVFEWEYGEVGHVILDVPNVDGAVVEVSGCGVWERIG